MSAWKDIVLGLLLAVSAGLLSYAGASQIDRELLNVDDVWFQADIKRVYSNMTNRWANHYRATVHPLFSLTTFATVRALQAALRIDGMTAVRITCGMVASFWTIALFVLFRHLGCRRFDASLFCLVALCSASAVFWFVVPETYALGSLAILLALNLAAAAETHTPSQWHYIAVSAATLSFTVTNWMAGLVATVVSHPWRTAVRISLLALALVLGLWGVQRETPEKPVMSVQRSWPGSGSAWGMIATGAWIGLLGLGIWSTWSLTSHRQFRLVLGLTLAGQLILHLLYSEETFLYSLHYGPLLVVLVGLGFLTRVRIITLSLAGVLLLSVGVNNWVQYQKVLELFPQYMSHGVVDRISK